MSNIDIRLNIPFAIFVCSISFLAQKIQEKNLLKDAVTSHRTGLTPHLLRFFEPRAPLPYLPPPSRKKPLLPYSGVGQYLDQFANPDDPDYQPTPPPTRPDNPRIFANRELEVQCRLDVPTRIEKKVAIRKQKAEQNKELIKQTLESWDPNKDPNIEGDPYKTLFVGKLSHEVSERKLRREFEEFGPIKRIRIVHDKTNGKPKGYAFIEYEHKSDMKDAYKATDGRKIEGKRVTVDVERGRSVPSWKPRWLGGGKGGDGRVARLPKNPTKQVVAKLVEKAVAGDEYVELAAARTNEPRAERGTDRRPIDDRDTRDARDRYRDRDGWDSRDRGRDGWGRGDRRDSRHSRERDTSYRSGQERDRAYGRDDRDRDGGGRRRKRDDYMTTTVGDGRDPGGRFLTSSHRDRERERVNGEYGRVFEDDGRNYNAVPPPGQSYGGGMVDEPEEGEVLDDRAAKRARG